jgi:hypothetical protein
MIGLPDAEAGSAALRLTLQKVQSAAQGEL